MQPSFCPCKIWYSYFTPDFSYERRDGLFFVQYSDEDNLFIGEVFGINDTLAFHGSSVQELESMFHQSVDNYLEMCREFGKTQSRCCP